MGSTSSTGTLFFTGLSSCSSDFQSIIQREVSITQLPLQKLQNEQTYNLNKKQALIPLHPAIANLGSAVAALGSIGADQRLSASSSFDIVSVENVGAAVSGTYTISNISTLAKATSKIWIAS